MDLKIALIRAKSAVKTWNLQFMRDAPPLKTPEAEDSFGNRQGRGSFGRTHDQHQEPTAQPFPEKFADATKTGAVAGALLGAGMVITAVASYGTATPIAMFFGGILVSATTAATLAFVGPALAVALGAPVAAVAGLMGKKQPQFPSFPHIPLPKPDMESARNKFTTVSEKLRQIFSRSAARTPEAEKPSASVATPPPPAV